MGLRYALIGCGSIALNHFTAALNNGLDISGLCDIDVHSVKSLTEKACFYGAAAAYTDYRAMLREARPELVAITTDNGNHARIALDCIEAGCHVIVEKPIALSLKDADAVIAAGRERGVCVCASHQNRFNASVQMMRSAIGAGRMGRLLYGTTHVRWNRGQEYYAKAPWRGTWAQDGGMLVNQCIHHIDLLLWLMGGKATEVFAYTDNLSHQYIETEDMGLALVKFAGGAYGVIEGTTDVFPRNLEETLYVFGEKGTMKAGGKALSRIEEWRFEDGLDDDEALNALNGEGWLIAGHTALYADVLRAIRTKTRPLADGEAGRCALELALAIHKSASEGRPVCLPLTDFSVEDIMGHFKQRAEE